MTKGRTPRTNQSPSAIAVMEAQKEREDDIRIKKLLEDFSNLTEEKVTIIQ